MDRTMELIQRAQSGDRDATNTLISENTGLIWSVVRKFSNRGYELEDLYQIGSIGLMKCITKFDLSYDVKFSTYAIPMIMGEIKRFIRDDGMIKVSRSIKELSVRAKYVTDLLTKELGREPTISELAAELKVSQEDLIMALETGYEIESLYSTVGQNDTSDYLIDRIAGEESYDESVIDNLALQQIISTLKPRERQIIMMRYFDEKTQTEIANEIGVSQVQVSRLEKKILKSLRESLA